ncbi:MAG: hypothetical protein CMI26_02700 [Opitutae bacterium]|nr:hypothetical protein [Opitutae bacterium]
MEGCSLQNQQKLVIGESIARLYNNDMKKLLFTMFVALLMVGCGGDTKKPAGDSPESNQTSAESPPAKTAEVGYLWMDVSLGKIIAEAIDSEKLDPRINGRNRNDFDLTELLDLLDPFKTSVAVYFAPNQKTPYTGWAKWMYDNGRIGGLSQYKDGRLDGLSTDWHENGQKWKEGTNKNGKQSGLWTTWYENGQKRGEGNYKDNEKDGLSTKWYKNGQMKDEITWKDGKLITGVVWRLNGEKCPVTNVVEGNGVLVSYNKYGTEKRRDTYKDGEIVRASKLTKDELPLDKFYELEDLLRGDGEMVRASSRTKGELPLDLGIPSHQSLSSRQSGIEPSGDVKFYELKDLITNLGGPVKARYIDIQLKMEGLAGDFERILEQNEHRIRDKALTILGNYTYEDAQLDGFQERVRVDLKKGFSTTLRKYRDGESDLIRQISFIQFVIQ